MQIFVLASIRENHDRFLWKHLLAFYMIANRPRTETKETSVFEIVHDKHSSSLPNVVRRNYLIITDQRGTYAHQ